MIWESSTFPQWLALRLTLHVQKVLSSFTDRPADVVLSSANRFHADQFFAFASLLPVIMPLEQWGQIWKKKNQTAQYLNVQPETRHKIIARCFN